MVAPGANLGLLAGAAAGQQQQMALNGGLGPAHGANGGLMNGFSLGGGSVPFDPTAPVGVDKLNAAFVARQQQLLGGGNFLLPRT